MPPNPINLHGLGAMVVTRPYRFIGFGAMGVTKPYNFTWLGEFLVVKFSRRGGRGNSGKLRQRTTAAEFSDHASGKAKPVNR